MFVVNLTESPNWIEKFANEVVSGHDIHTLRAQIHTSVRHTETVKPDKELLDALSGARRRSNAP